MRRELRRWCAYGAAALGLLLGLAPLATAASHRTTNFVVNAPSVAIAQQIANHAEACRLAIARAWLGKELPPWSQPCPIQVKITAGNAGGLTTFGFTGDRVSSRDMQVEGRLDRILASSLPHEITHTVFAECFGGPMPRWADEGACLLSEDLLEINRHDQIVAALLARRQDLPLARLFSMEEYPDDLMGFYGQGYSVSRFLVEVGGRPRFLRFVQDGLQSDWNTAARSHYGLADCRELERAWKSWYRVNYLETTAALPDGRTTIATAAE